MRGPGFTAGALTDPTNPVARAGVRGARAPSPGAMNSAGISSATVATAVPRIAFTLRT